MSHLCRASIQWSDTSWLGWRCCWCGCHVSPRRHYYWRGRSNICQPRLQERGLAIESAIFVDEAYTLLHANMAPLEQLGRFFSPTAVYAFGSLKALQASAAKDAAMFGNATTYVHCDADGIDSGESDKAAACCLAAGGISFRLHKKSGVTTECWRLGPNGEHEILHGGTAVH